MCGQACPKVATGTLSSAHNLWVHDGQCTLRLEGANFHHACQCPRSLRLCLCLCLRLCLSFPLSLSRSLSLSLFFSLSRSLSFSKRQDAALPSGGARLGADMGVQKFQVLQVKASGFGVSEVSVRKSSKRVIRPRGVWAREAVFRRAVWRFKGYGPTTCVHVLLCAEGPVARQHWNSAWPCACASHRPTSALAPPLGHKLYLGMRKTCLHAGCNRLVGLKPFEDSVMIKFQTNQKNIGARDALSELMKNEIPHLRSASTAEAQSL